MGDRRSPHPPLDEAIDRAVREMMNVDPTPEFESRVMRRLERPSPQRVAWPRFAAAGAVAAMLIVLAATFLGTKSTAPVVVPQSSAVVATGAPVQPRDRVPTVTADPRSTARNAGTRAGHRRRDAERTVAAASVKEPSIPTVPPLDGPDALAVKGIEQKPASVPAIAIATLKVAQLDLQPLQTLDERREE